MKYYARTHDDIREIVSASALDLSRRAEVSEIAALRARAAGGAGSARYIARSHSCERIAQQDAHSNRDIDRSGYAANTVASVQGYEIPQYQAVCIRAGESQRGRETFRGMDQGKYTVSMREELLVRTKEGVCLHSAGGFIRGGNWDNGTNDGAFTLNLNNAPSNVNTNIGFRCARYASSAGADGQNKNSTEFSQRSHRSILTHSFFQAYTFWRRISDLYIRFVLVATLLAKAQGGVSGSLLFV